MYHISDLKKYNRCPLLYWKSIHAEPLPYQSYVRLDEAITDLAAVKIHAENAWKGTRGDEGEKALSAMKDHEWLMKARFEYGGLRIKVPFLHHVNGVWDLYFLFAGLYPHADDMQFYCDTVWVLENLNIPLGKIQILHLNSSYVRGEQLDPDELFVLSDTFFNNNSHPSIQVEEAIRKNLKDVSAVIAEMDGLREDSLPLPVHKPRCTGRSRCRFYSECFRKEEKQDSNSILTLTGARERYAMQKEGKEHLRDADPKRIEGLPLQYAEIMADRNGGLFFDQLALKAWLSDVTWPVSFLDFEWERYAIPPYQGMKPYDVLPFEYSLYVLNKDGSVYKNVFLSWHDDRRELVESLIREMPETGTIIAYNAEGAEKIRIQEFADLLPEYREKLEDMNARMKDLQMPFTGGIVYDTGMAGVWTLKQIMSIMHDRSYNDLVIHQGMDAVFQWRHLDREDPDADSQAIIEDLKKYCMMDSYAAAGVFRWLLKLAGTPIAD